jgi:hypothetical protein
MKNNIKLEEGCMFLFSIFLFNELNYDWWYYLVFLLAPDMSMLGYLVNSKVGAICYNLFHHKGVALVIYMIGFFLGNETLLFIGIVLFGHASFDRIWGYGLKYYDSFNRTHLGIIGKKQL